MDMVELGNRIRAVRSKALNMNQIELAEALRSHQGVISRLEKGIGGSLELVLDFISLLEKKGLNGSVLFTNTFSIEQLSANYKPGKLNAAGKLVTEKFTLLKDTIQKGYEQMVELEGLVTPEFKSATGKSKKIIR
ncbi:helix-turn-helix domain-containing protein [Niabella hirudinis]|uniref:helix-turn-helix domain-containing protein n=1 Tax=Niabella hirudinis TaxID=1285929 RepID=UPI003EBAE615